MWAVILFSFEKNKRVRQEENQRSSLEELPKEEREERREEDAGVSSAERKARSLDAKKPMRVGSTCLLDTT